MLYPVLYGPILEARSFSSGLDFDGEILVETGFPVRVGRPVKEDSAHRKTMLAKRGFSQPSHRL